jgi:site-specific recombinase XerD
MNDFFKTIRSFLLEYLPKQRCCSKNTIKSYRDALNLMVEYLRSEKKMKLSKIDFSVFNRELIFGYLDWLEAERGCSASTRNQRLMVLRSFFKYAGETDCVQIAIHLEMKKIPRKKTQQKIVDFLSEDALEALLSQPSIAKRTEFRNRFFMVLMYETAARCDELIQMKVRDLNLRGRQGTG